MVLIMKAQKRSAWLTLGSLVVGVGLAGFRLLRGVDFGKLLAKACGGDCAAACMVTAMRRVFGGCWLFSGRESL